MSTPINWTRLEQQGLITPPPGREEAAKEKMAAMKAAAQADKPKPKSK